MEDALAPRKDGKKIRPLKVLILVVMEDALAHHNSADYKSVYEMS